MAVEQIHIEPTKVIDYALSLQKVYKDLESLPITKLKTICCWNPSPTGYLKLNVEVTMFFYHHKACLGAILKDEECDIVMAGSKVENELNDPETIELLPMFLEAQLFRSLQLCVDLGFSKLILESDCILMVKELQAKAKSFSRLGNLQKEVKGLLELFAEYKIQYVHWMENEAACAYIGLQFMFGMLSWDDVSTSVSQAIWLDKNRL